MEVRPHHKPKKKEEKKIVFKGTPGSGPLFLKGFGGGFYYLFRGKINKR